ncbi:MAG: hypothetical protein ABI342_06920 [Nitrososphaera sp.]|jgi:hypothetical protein
MHKKILTAIMAIVIVAAMGLGISPTTQTNAYAAGPKYQPVTNDIPTEEWFSFKGITLQPGEFLDMVDTTPFLTTRGHVAMYIPCNSDGTSKISFVQGRVDVGVNTLSPISPEYLPQLSTPGQSCLYHFDIGTPNGVTDFAIVNTSHDPITFGDRNTATFSIAEGLKKLSG